MKKLFPVTAHTDHVGPGCTFVAIPGYHADGTQYVASAIKKGIRTIVLEESAALDQESEQLIKQHAVTITRVTNTRKALAQLSAQAAGYPADKLKIIGITGTKGKTTTAHLLFHILQASGISAALIGTVNNQINYTVYPPSLTTPQPDYLHQFLKECVEQQIEWVVMEVAAHAVTLDRIDGIKFDCIIITNIAQEHLEFYDSMDEYAAAKINLLKYRKLGAPAWLNGADKRLQKITANTCFFYSLGQSADITGNYHPGNLFVVDVTYQDQIRSMVCSALMGKYNAYNLLAAVSGALTAGLLLEHISHAIKTFTGLRGRLERYQLPNGAVAIIDYAHNPLSYEALLSTLKVTTEHLMVIFGAGGERDADRRPQMAAIVAQYADQIIITTDNPRHEDLQQIVEDLLSGIPENKRERVIIEPDRKRAIEIAYQKSHPGSLIALLGKGPDEYQLIGNKKIAFSERTILEQLR